MTDKIRFTILGCGSSGGVPRIGPIWGACDPTDLRNTRTRCSLLVERISTSGITRLLIDSSPDMRQQLLAANVPTLDAVIYTHEHADHLHGIDDLRMITLGRKERLPVYTTNSATQDVLTRFHYAFTSPKGSDYPPILDRHDLQSTQTITGPGGEITVTSFTVPHGRLDVAAVRINDVVYTPDISGLPADTNPLRAMDCWILDALRYAPHPSHINVETALNWIQEFAPKRAILTNLHIDLDYKVLDSETPDHVTPAYDQFSFEVTA